MISSEKNIEAIERLVKVVKESFQLNREYLKLEFIDWAIRVVMAMLMLVILSILIVSMLAYLSLAAIFLMAPELGYVQASLVVVAAYLLIVIVLLLFRKTLIGKPLIRFLIKVLAHEHH